MNYRLELLNRAKIYMEKLAGGADPFTGENLPGDTALNNPRLSRCFNFVADVLQELIDNGGEVTRAVKKDASRKFLPDFTITDEQRVGIQLSAEPVKISKFAEKLNAQVDIEKMRRINPAAFNKWLVEKGYLSEVTVDGKQNKVATPKGEAIGIHSEITSYGGSEYYSTTFNIDAQWFLMEHLDEVIDISNGRRAEQR